MQSARQLQLNLIEGLQSLLEGKEPPSTPRLRAIQSEVLKELESLPLSEESELPSDHLMGLALRARLEIRLSPQEEALDSELSRRWALQSQKQRVAELALQLEELGFQLTPLVVEKELQLFRETALQSPQRMVEEFLRGGKAHPCQQWFPQMSGEELTRMLAEVSAQKLVEEFELQLAPLLAGKSLQELEHPSKLFLQWLELVFAREWAQGSTPPPPGRGQQLMRVLRRARRSLSPEKGHPSLQLQEKVLQSLLVQEKGNPSVEALEMDLQSVQLQLKELQSVQESLPPQLGQQLVPESPRAQRERRLKKRKVVVTGQPMDERKVVVMDPPMVDWTESERDQMKVVEREPEKDQQTVAGREKKSDSLKVSLLAWMMLGMMLGQTKMDSRWGIPLGWMSSVVLWALVKAPWSVRLMERWSLVILLGTLWVLKTRALGWEWMLWVMWLVLIAPVTKRVVWKVLKW